MDVVWKLDEGVIGKGEGKRSGMRRKRNLFRNEEVSVSWNSWRGKR